MKSEIRNIRYVCKSGAHGDPNKDGIWTYGRRPDGRTVACKQEHRTDGSVVISSTWKSPACMPGEVEDCRTEFTAAEWAYLVNNYSKAAIVDEHWMIREGNRILDERKSDTAGQRQKQ
jgi:hypothetical protein